MVIHISQIYIENWIERLKSRGIFKFEHAELPEDLKDRRLLQKASVHGNIKKIGIVKKTGSFIWRIVTK